MKTTVTKTNDKSHHLIKAGVMMTLTFLLLTGGTAYASHSHHDYNSGLSISLGYVYYPSIHHYNDTYSYPRHNHHYKSHYKRGNYGHHNSWRNKHGRKHHRKHHNRHHDY